MNSRNQPEGGGNPESTLARTLPKLSDMALPNGVATVRPRNGSGLRGIARIIGLLGAVMLGLLGIWKVLGQILVTFWPGADLTPFYVVRFAVTTAVMSILAAWLMLRYRRRYEVLLRHESGEAQRMRLFYENIVRDAGEAIVSLDREGVIRAWNHAAEEIYGYTAAEMIGQSVDRLLPDDLRTSDEGDRLTQLVAQRGYVRNFETRRVRKDGTTILVRITRSALKDADGRMIGSTAIVSDVTTEKEMEARLIQAEKLAAIGQAAASIAHEVRNALAGISGTVEVLKGSAAWKELPEEFAGEFDLQVSRIAHIVNDLLSYARPGTLNTSRTDLHKLLERVISQASGAPEAEGKKVAVELHPGRVFAEVDSGRLEQAFTNVVTNAFQAMEEGGTLRISTARNDGVVKVSFSDSGCGMPEETRAHAFDPFFTTKVRGTGLGLPIVRAIMEAHNGTVELESKTGSGTTVTLTLPAESARSIQEEVQMTLKKPGVRIALAAIVAVFGMTSGLLLAADHEYVSAAKCKMCHMSQYKVWEASKHAKAFDNLKPEDQKNPECLACHTTGAGKTAAEGADLKGVQCEACHGPGNDYKSMKIMNKKAYAENKDAQRKMATDAGLVLPDENTCKTCHNDKSPTFKGFDFASAKEKIKHWN